MTAVRTPEADRKADLGRLMRPATIAVVGATDRAGSYAAETLVNLELIGFPGPVYGVNPKRTEVMGRVCVPSCRRPAGGRRCRRGGHSGRRGRGRHRPGGRPRVWRCGGVQRGVRRGGVRARVPRRPRGRGAPPRAACLRSQLQRDRLPGLTHGAVGRCLLRSRARPRGARLPERQRRRQRPGHSARAALPHRHRQRQPGDPHRRRLSHVPGRGDRPLPPRRGRRSVPGG